VIGSPDFQPFGFAGGPTDTDTGLIRVGTRDYDPGVGRWTTKDTWRFGGGQTNLFAYSQGDPINRTDPSGNGSVTILPAWCGSLMKTRGSLNR
jgi:RHS repeat-associated protein